MKNIYSVFLMLCFPLIFLGQSTNQNYVHTTTYTIETTDENVSDDDKRESIIYYDGLGKPIQSIEKHFGNDKQNWVTPILYDEFGRQTKNYLPYPDSNPNQNNDDLYYRWDTDQLILDTEEYYQNKFPEDLPDGGSSIYSASRLENSSLGRILEQGAPGEAWKVDFVNEEGYEYDLSDFNLSLRNSDLLKQGDNTIIGSISLNDYRIELDFSVSWSNENKLKVGPVKDLGQDLPDLYLGDILHFGSATGYKAKIKNDHLVIYSDETVQSSVDVTLTHQIPNFNGWYNYNEAIFDPSVSQCVDNMVAGSGIIRLKISENGLVELIVSGGWPGSCMITTGNIHYINYGGLIPDCELGYIIGSYKAKIENGYLVFYSENLPENLSGAILNSNVDVSDYIVDNDHTIKYGYGTNQSGEVTKYKVGFIGGNTEKTSLSKNGSYAPHQLYKTITKDENWQPNQQHPKDHTVEKFTNKQGQVVLKRTYNKNLPHDTHYVYDDYGNLTYVLSPEASRAIAGLYFGPVLEGALTKSWVNLVEVDSKFAQAYERKLQDYQDEEILNADVENAYGGQGGFTIDATNSDGGAKLSLNISFSSSTPLQLKRGYLMPLKEFGEFKDAELGRVSGDGYSYIFSISKNQILIEGEGKLSQLNATLTNTGKLSYSHNYPWTDYLEVDPGVAKDYNKQLAGYKNEEILSANIPNPYGARGGMNISVDDSDNIAITLNHSSSKKLAFSKQSIIPLKVSRHLEDRELDVLEINGASYSFSVQDNNLVIQAMDGIPTLSFNGTIFGPVTPWYPGKVMNRSIVPGLGYIYHYDHRNRLIEKKIPGKGWEYIVYDKLDRPVLTQDANLRLDDQWLFTKYDAHGRVVYTGLYQFNPTETNAVEKRLELQALVDNQTGNTAIQSIYSEERLDAPVTVAGTTIYYSNEVFPGQVEELNNVNYYDTYDNLAILGDTFSGQSFLPQQVADEIDYAHTQGKLTVARVRVLGTNNWINSVSLYDKKSRPLYSYSHNEYLGSRDYSYSQLNFIGEVEEAGSLHLKGSENIKVIDEFTYDPMGRLLTQVQTINGGSPELIVNNSYDELGQLKNKKVGGAVASAPENSNGLQTVDFSYNIRGWLTAINDPNVQTGPDLFRFGIYYDQAMGSESSPLYNGNISSVKWRSANDPQKTRIYNYDYDALNRLRGAAFERFGYDVDRNGFPLPEPVAGHPDNYSVEGIGYDRNGNILELTRYGMETNTVGGPVYDIMDQLSYDYKSYGNQLEKVSDTGTDQGFKDGANTGNDYAYDLNGNLTSDLNKGISSIEYNHLNMPTKVTVTGANAGVLDYTYSADGTKLKKKKTQGGNTTITDYAGDFVYENNTLKQITHPQGYIEPDGGGWQYVYRLTDIWGNTRITFADDNGNGSIDPANEIRREHNYYPLGMEHSGHNHVLSGVKNNLKTYQGQEFTEDLGLNTHEWKYRISDPAIGRFWQVDPLAEDYYYNSTYAFQENKIGMGVELEGLELKRFIEGFKELMTGYDRV